MGARRSCVCRYHGRHSQQYDAKATVRLRRVLLSHSHGRFTWQRLPCFTACAVLYGVAYGLSFPRILRLIVSMVLVDFVLVGIVVSTLAWYEASRLPLRDCFRLRQMLMIHSIAGTEAPFRLR